MLTIEQVNHLTELIAAHAQAEVDESWSGAQHPSDREEIKATAEDTRNALAHYLTTLYGPVPAQQAAPNDVLDARILVVQIDSLISVAERLTWTDDAEEAQLARGAIEHARKVSAPFRYNGAAPARPIGLSEQDKLDAARYRWLRDQNIFDQLGSFTPYVVQGQTMRMLEGKEVDVAVDAAILAAKEAP